VPREAISSNIAITICFVVRVHVGRNVTIFFPLSRIAPSKNPLRRAVSVQSLPLVGRPAPSASSLSIRRRKQPPSVRITLNALNSYASRFATILSAQSKRVQPFQGPLRTPVFARPFYQAPPRARLVTSMSLQLAPWRPPTRGYYLLV
jgi:hypothetical protein